MKVIIIKGLSFVGNKITFMKKNLHRIRDKIIFNEVEKIYTIAKKNENKQEIPLKKIQANYIWIFWAQGYDNAPDLIKKCINRIRKYSGGYEVVVIDNKNIKQYVDIPEYIYNKVYEKKITLTHFSDILRINLLANYGGIWVDSTVFVDKRFMELIEKEKNIVTIPQNNIDYNVSQGKWSAWMIGTKKVSPYLETFKKFFNIYWEKNDKLLCYFLIDYLLEYAYRNDLSFKNDIDLIEKIDFSVYELVEKRNDTCTEKEFEKFMHNNYINKLNYKLDYSFEKIDTYAFYIINK